ncbi:MAG: hypothetical protein GVY35_03400, partial [Bacteroidetes bacterium]|nr:hypothetical protein [Bacteroidota bacterium]
LDGVCRFRQNNRWFAGQTAPQSSNGSGGIFVHAWIGGRKVEGSNIIIEHIRFIDGRDRASSGGALDITRDGSPQRSVLLRNCSFWWGVDETVAFAPGWDGGRQDQMSVIDCMFPEPTWFSGDDPRGKPLFHKYGAHRFEYRGMFVPGYKIRAPGCKFYMSASFCNIVGYEGSVPPVYLMKQPPWWGSTIGDRPDLAPAGFWLFHSGNWVIGGPQHDADTSMNDLAIAFVPNAGRWDYSIWFVTHTISGNSDSFSKRVDGSVVPVDTKFDRDGHTFYDAYTEPQLWPYRAPFPSEDTVANVVNHCGPWPGDRHAGEQRIIQTFQDGGSLVYTFSGERIVPEDHPDGQMASASRTPGSNLPANPFDTDTNGLTVIENWLEQQHIAVGGAPYEDFGKRLRFPWGGIVTVETNGTVTFEPEDMAAGREGVIEVTRADGSTVTVTCRAV